jgi:Phosphoesterase family
MKFFLAALLVLGFSQSSMAMNGKHFDRIITVIFENADYSEVIRQPLFKYLADQGAHFSNFLAVTHPSQGNYIALTSGSLHGLWCDIDDTADSRCWLGPYDETVDLDVKNIVDLLEAKGVTWRVYAEKFPGNCFNLTASQPVSASNISVLQNSMDIVVTCPDSSDHG